MVSDQEHHRLRLLLFGSRRKYAADDARFEVFAYRVPQSVELFALGGTFSEAAADHVKARQHAAYPAERKGGGVFKHRSRLFARLRLQLLERNGLEPAADPLLRRSRAQVSAAPVVGRKSGKGNRPACPGGKS